MCPESSLYACEGFEEFGGYSVNKPVEVARQRTVKVGTISLNLQKMPYFVRVGRAVYAFDASKK